MAKGAVQPFGANCSRFPIWAVCAANGDFVVDDGSTPPGSHERWLRGEPNLRIGIIPVYSLISSITAAEKRSLSS